MSDTLRDQLLGLGFKSAPKPERKPDARPAARQHGNGGRPAPGGNTPGGQGRGPQRPHAAAATDGKHERTGAGRPERRNDGKPAASPRPQQSTAERRGPKPVRTREDIDLAKAYAIRAQREKDERIEAERLKQEEARLRCEAKAKLEELLKDKGLNHADADIARHFPYGGKIKRIYVTADQLKALNAGELGVLQLNGRYLLVTAELLAEAESVFAPSVALKVDPNAPASDDPYADPQYQVPDDLVW
ncbi:Nucleoprotein/polynucleotide-associated enzyme [Xanthomonas campestris pv. nigromaculans]|nr:Nucleoprotein/polynucleotide-associated enzyme [Xanthomonas campestris pv. nigromaculans]